MMIIATLVLGFLLGRCFMGLRVVKLIDDGYLLKTDKWYEDP